MAFSEVEKQLRGWVTDYHRVANEISPTHEEACADELMAALRKLCDSVILEKQLQRDQLVEEGQCIIADIVKKTALLVGDKDATEENAAALTEILVPPYEKSISILQQKLKSLDEMFDKRNASYNQMISEVYTISADIARDVPFVEHSLSESNMLLLSDLHRSFVEEKNHRLRERKDYEQKLNEIKKYLGSTESPEFVSKLDKDSLQKFKEYIKELESAYEARKELFSRLESKVNLLCHTLDHACDLGDTDDGSESRLEFLRNKIEELNIMKQDKLKEIIPRCIQRLGSVWRELCLDLNLRVTFDSEEHTSENLENIENEIARLETLRREPARAAVLKKINDYREIRLMEGELQEAAKDPGRLSRRGFSQVIRKEGMMRKHISQAKPVIVNALLRTLKQWQDENSGEKFYLENSEGVEDLSSTLTEELKRVQSFPTMARTIKPIASSAASTSRKAAVQQHPPRNVRSAPTSIDRPPRTLNTSVPYSRPSLPSSSSRRASTAGRGSGTSVSPPPLSTRTKPAPQKATISTTVRPSVTSHRKPLYPSSLMPAAEPRRARPRPPQMIKAGRVEKRREPPRLPPTIVSGRLSHRAGDSSGLKESTRYQHMPSSNFMPLPSTPEEQIFSRGLSTIPHQPQAVTNISQVPEMSYFDESLADPSFDYNRDAF